MASTPTFFPTTPVAAETTFKPIFQSTGLGPINTPTTVAPTNFISQYALNGHLHELELCIINESGTYGISPTSIISLNIENTLSNWVVSGDITVFYNAELAEAFNTTNGKNFV